MNHPLISEQFGALPIEVEFKPRWYVYLIAIAAGLYYLQKEKYIHLDKYALAGKDALLRKIKNPNGYDVPPHLLENI